MTRPVTPPSGPRSWRRVLPIPTGPPATPLWLDALALGLVILAGGCFLAMPFWGDQALFTLYARELTRGAVLYRDVLDIKQPGVFIFYAVGGWLFGFTEVGIHLFELAYWVAFSVFALVALRPYFTTRWGPPLVPVFTVVVYYLYAGLLDPTQIEILVAFPLLVAWWLIDQAVPGTSRGLKRYAGAGLATAAVVLLKYLYLLIILSFLVYAVLRSRRSGIPIADIRRSVGAFLVTLLIPLLGVVAYFAAYGQLGRIWWAYFEFAPAAHMYTPRPFSYLKLGARRFMIGHAPFLILAAFSFVHELRQRSRPQLDLMAGMALWTASGAIAFVALQGWPEYKWPLFTVPVGILAVTGAETIVVRARSLSKQLRTLALAAGTALGVLSFILGAPVAHVQTRLLGSVAIGIGAGIAAEMLISRPRLSRRMLQVHLAALGAAIGLAAIGPVHKVRVVMEHDFALTADARRDLQRSLNYSYLAVDKDLETLRSGDVLPGPFYVFGNPLLLLRANRSQASPILGWGPQFLDSRAWRELHADLRSTLPPYIIVDRTAEPFIRSRCPAIMELIESSYQVAFVGASGTWYVLTKTNTRHD
jgi:hypothetical protein